MQRENRKQGANRQRMRGIMEDTLFLQSRTGVLEVQVAVTPFPVVAAPPATGGWPATIGPSVGGAQSPGDGTGSRRVGEEAG